MKFFRDITHGLLSSPKRLDAKYFYDTEGDKLFQEIMHCEEYYLTGCEMEIITLQTAAIASQLMAGGSPFDLIELGAGDATKSIHLIRCLQERKADFIYIPIDISGHVISGLNNSLPRELPGLIIKGLEGEYFPMLQKASENLSHRKIVLFMGANIGNMPVASAHRFCAELRGLLSPGDLALIGFDLKKDPQTILSAYNDRKGITAQFNLNLLERINRELGADFDTSKFRHFAMYDPETGSCKSYLVSIEKQEVTIPGAPALTFDKDECINMEISQKYSPDDISGMALRSGFAPGANFYDTKGWFVDTLWSAI